MTSPRSIRVRFAPAPTGMMHLGNVRTALINYLFAQQKNGTFIVRIEDTDQQRNYDPKAEKIVDDLLWLGLDFHEGPFKGGHYEPYFQSQRDHLYREKLTVLEHKGMIYRCFCTPEELEKKRVRQIALKLPPRYDRTCAKLTAEQLSAKLDASTPFVWRFKMPQDTQLTIHDLARGDITFDMQHFSDFPLTRADGSFTFIFANFVDDLTMVITHVIRGEDHLTNTANQAALYQAFDATIPVFCHLPIICNAQGVKLSKRDFGFSLQDLRTAGFLPEAIDNYLALIGGGTFISEIMDLETLAREFNFDTMNSTGHIRYDVEKLRWLNHKWIDRLEPRALYDRALGFITQQFPQASDVDADIMINLLQVIKTDMVTLADAQAAIAFFFNEPVQIKERIAEHVDEASLKTIQSLIAQALNLLDTPDEFMNRIKTSGKTAGVPMKDIFTTLRLALTGQSHGPALNAIITVLGSARSRSRLEQVV